MSISVMQQALDAITNVLAGGDFDNPYVGLKEAGAALRQAIDMSEKHVHISDKHRHEWGLVTDDALIEEVRRRGFTIRDAQISPKIKDEYELCCQKYDTCTEPCTPRGSHLAKREWVGLTDEERGMVVNANFGIGVWEMARAIEAKLKEKNIKNTLEPQTLVKESFHKEWIGLDPEQMRNTPIEFNRGALWAERYLKERNYK